MPFQSTSFRLIFSLLLCFNLVPSVSHLDKKSTVLPFTFIGTIAWGETMLSEDQLFGKIIERATSAYRDGRYRDAIKHFERAMMLRTNPNIHWNLSVCYYKLGDYQKSLSHANEYLDNGSPTAKMRSKVEARKRELLKHLQRAYLSPKTESVPKEPKTAVTSPLSKPPAQTQNRLPTEQTNISSSPKIIKYQTPQTQSNQSVIWGSVGGVLLVSCISLHLYADSVWEDRPMGGGSLAKEAQRNALLLSWSADALLVLSMTSLVVATVSYFNEANAYTVQSCSDCTHPSSRPFYTSAHQPVTQVFNGPTFNLLKMSTPSKPHIYHGGVLGWRLDF